MIHSAIRNRWKIGLPALGNSAFFGTIKLQYPHEVDDCGLVVHLRAFLLPSSPYRVYGSPRTREILLVSNHMMQRQNQEPCPTPSQEEEDDEEQDNGARPPTRRHQHGSTTFLFRVPSTKAGGRMVCGSRS